MVFTGYSYAYSSSLSWFTLDLTTDENALYPINYLLFITLFLLASFKDYENKDMVSERHPSQDAINPSPFLYCSLGFSCSLTRISGSKTRSLRSLILLPYRYVPFQRDKYIIMVNHLYPSSLGTVRLKPVIRIPSLPF